MIEVILSRLNSIPADKIAHFASGVVLFAAVQWVSPLWAFFSVICAAVAKEIYDAFHPDIHTSDWWDAIATVAGGAVGLFIELF